MLSPTIENEVLDKSRSATRDTSFKLWSPRRSCFGLGYGIGPTRVKRLQAFAILAEGDSGARRELSRTLCRQSYDVTSIGTDSFVLV